MNNATKAFNQFKATGLNHSKTVVQLYSRGIRGQHKAVADTISYLSTLATKAGTRNVANFKCGTMRTGDNYTITVEYDGFYNSQVFISELWKRLSPYFSLKNV